MLKIQQVFQIKNILCVPKTQILSFVPASIDIAGGISLAIHGLLNSRLKRRVEWTESSTIFVI